MVVTDDTTELRRVLRALPRRRVGLVLLVVLVNLALVACLRGRAVAEVRYASPATWESASGEYDLEWEMAGGSGGLGSSNSLVRKTAYRRRMIAEGRAPWRLSFVPPWEWTAAEWSETVFPWR